MSVDRELRDRLADALAGYMKGGIRSHALDDVVWPISRSETSDEDVRLVAEWIWMTYDDTYNHRVFGSSKLWDAYRAAFAFLKSDATLGKRTLDDFAASRSAGEQASDEAALAAYELPEYDPDLHTRAFESRLMNWVFTRRVRWWHVILIVLGLASVATLFSLVAPLL